MDSACLVRTRHAVDSALDLEQEEHQIRPLGSIDPRSPCNNPAKKDLNPVAQGTAVSLLVASNAWANEGCFQLVPQLLPLYLQLMILG